MRDPFLGLAASATDEPPPAKRPRQGTISVEARASILAGQRQYQQQLAENPRAGEF